MRTQTVRLNVDVPETIHRKFKSYCAIRGLSMTEEVIRLIAKAAPSSTRHTENEGNPPEQATREGVSGERNVASNRRKSGRSKPKK